MTHQTPERAKSMKKTFWFFYFTIFHMLQVMLKFHLNLVPFWYQFLAKFNQQFIKN